MPHSSFLKATTGTGATATRAMISVTSCAYHLKGSRFIHRFMNMSHAEDITDGKVFLGGLNYDSTEDSIKAHFEDNFGQVLAARHPCCASR